MIPTEMAVTTIVPPDESPVRTRVTEIQNIFDFHVTNEATCKMVPFHVSAIDSILGDAEKMYKEPCSLAHQLHTMLTGRWGSIKKPLEDLKKRLRSEVVSFDAERERKRLELQRRLQAEEDERQRKAKEEAESALPWEIEDVPEPPAPRAIALPPPPPMEGMQSRNLPWAGEVFDLLAFCREAVVRADKGDRTLLEQLSINASWLKLQASQKKETLEKLIPGIRAVRGKTVSFR